MGSNNSPAVIRLGGVHQSQLASVAVAAFTMVFPPQRRAVTNEPFSITQATNWVATNMNSDTTETEGYLFNLSHDKLFTGGAGLTNPIGRSLRINWPDGLEAQAITAGPNPGGAKILLSRQDGQLFDLRSFIARLLANTGGAGAAIEVMPLLNGEDGLPNPLMYDATGYYGSTFAYVTPELAGFNSYKITLYVDFALMSLTLIDASLPSPALEILAVSESTIQLSWSTDYLDFVPQTTTNLAASYWTAVTNSVVTKGGRFTVEFATGQSSRFFRLKK